VTTTGLAHSDSALLDAIRTIRWPARRKSPAGLAGTHLSRVLGMSAEFTEYRAYRQGDDTRRIDWKLLARSNRAYIRLSNDRTVLSTTFLIDASGSLAYPDATLEKWHYARQLVLGLAAAAHRSGDPIGLMVATSDGARRLLPRTRRDVIHEMARLLAAVTPGGDKALAPVLSTLRSAGRVAIVSDFLGDAEELRGVAAQLAAAGREVHAVHVLHADELDPPHRTSLLIDPEHPELKRPITDNTRRRYLATFSAWRERTARDWRMAGTYYTAVATTEPVARAVRRIALSAAARSTDR
jgi:uncharacterized protein (DUF58 family)